MEERCPGKVKPDTQWNLRFIYKCSKNRGLPVRHNRIVEPSGLRDRDVMVVEDVALEILSATDADISALVTDLHFDTIDGFELTGRVRGHRRTKRLPIIV